MMPKTLGRKTRLLFLVGFLVLASAAYYRNWVFGHASVDLCSGGPAGCATVPTTFTQTIPLGAGSSFSVPIPTGNHDLRVVVAVGPRPIEPENDKDHGVGAIDMIMSSALAPDVRASWTGIDGNGKIVNHNNVAISAGQVLFEANPSGSVTLQYAGLIAGVPNLSIVNTGSIGRPVTIRWIH